LLRYLRGVIRDYGVVPHEGVFYTLRLLLGACEAGFFPGIIFYLTLWFPAVYRARVVSFFMLAIPISSIVYSVSNDLSASAYYPKGPSRYGRAWARP
jgi:MFS family permease